MPEDEKSLSEKSLSQNLANDKTGLDSIEVKDLLGDIPILEVGEKSPIIRVKPMPSFKDSFQEDQIKHASQDQISPANTTKANTTKANDTVLNNKILKDKWERVVYCISGEVNQSTLDKVFSKLSIYNFQDGIVTLQAADHTAYQQANKFHLKMIKTQFQKLADKNFDFKQVIVIEPMSSVIENNRSVNFTESLHQVGSEAPSQAYPSEEIASQNRITNNANLPNSPLALGEAIKKLPNISNDSQNGISQFRRNNNANHQSSSTDSRRGKRLVVPCPFAKDDPSYDLYHQLSLPLVARHRFDHLMEDEGNIIAKKAAYDAAHEGDEDAPNPLVFYGETGSGKTHLLQAIAHEMMEHYPDLKILCCSANIFKHEFALAIQNRRMVQLREMIRGFDVLLFDDSHHLPIKHNVVEEFLHILSEFRSQGKRVIVTSLLKPADYREYIPALRARLLGGLSVEIKSPCQQVRITILEKELIRLKLDHRMPADALKVIAMRVPGSVREMIGMLNNIVHHFKHSNSDWSAIAVINYINQHMGTARRVTSAEIMGEVCRYYKVTKEEFLSRRRLRHITHSRHVTMYLIKDMTSKSLPEIGRDLGGLDHTSVIYGVRRMTALMEQDPGLKAEIEELRQKLLYKVPDFN